MSRTKFRFADEYARGRSRGPRWVFTLVLAFVLGSTFAAQAGTNWISSFPSPLATANGGSGVASPTAHGMMIGEGSSAMTPLVLGAGQLPIGTTSGDPSAAALTAGTGISISSVSGSITISTSGSGSGTYTISTKTANYSVSGTTDPGTLFLTTGASAQVTFTLPAATGTGHWFAFQSDAAQILEVLAGTGDKIRQGELQSASAGNVQTTTGGRGDALLIVDISTNNWTILNSTGTTWTIN